MQRSPRSGKAGIYVVLALLAVGTVLAVLAKSHRASRSPEPSLPPAAVQPAAPTPPAAPPPEAPQATAILKGRVLFTGAEIPVRKQMDVTKDKEACECDVRDGARKPTKLDESLVVDAGSKGIANAVVWVKGMRGGAKRLEAVVDQHACQFVPHVALLTPGGKVTLLNPDQISHNYSAHAQVPGNPSQNLSISKMRKQASYPEQGSFAKPEFVHVTCDIHPWMAMWVAVVDSGFAVVSDEKGQFSIPGLPPGPYTLGVWHETLAKEPIERAVTLGPEGGEIQVSLGP